MNMLKSYVFKYNTNVLDSVQSACLVICEYGHQSYALGFARPQTKVDTPESWTLGSSIVFKEYEDHFFHLGGIS